MEGNSSFRVHPRQNTRCDEGAEQTGQWPQINKELEAALREISEVHAVITGQTPRENN